MADDYDWDADADASGGASAISGGLLDPSTFPSHDPDASAAGYSASDNPSPDGAPEGPAIDRPAPEFSGPLDTDLHAQVLDDIQKAQAALLSVQTQPGLRLIDAYPGMNRVPAGGYPPAT